MIRLIQAQWRRAIVRQTRVVQQYDAFLLKVKSHPAPGAQCYYIDRRTGTSSWDKPWLLGPHVDLTEQPSHRWVSLYYEHEGAYYQHYCNPWTGKFSHLTQDRAARVMQSLVRNAQLRPLLIPLEDLRRIMPFVRSAKREYEADPKKLMSVINYALTAHVVDLDEETGKRLYVEAIGLSEANPLVTRAFGLFVLATCEAPVGPNRARALKLMADAKVPHCLLPLLPLFAATVFLLSFPLSRKQSSSHHIFSRLPSSPASSAATRRTTSSGSRTSCTSWAACATRATSRPSATARWSIACCTTRWAEFHSLFLVLLPFPLSRPPSVNICTRFVLALLHRLRQPI